MARDGGGGFGTVLTWGAMGLGGYLIYRWWQGQATAAAVAPPAPTSTAVANSTAPAPSSSQTSALDALFLGMVQAATTANPWATVAKGHPGTLTADQWGYYLGQVTNTPAPDALQAFPSFNRATNWPNITAAQYWGGIAPLVAQQKGMTGLGFFGGLGRWIWGTR